MAKASIPGRTKTRLVPPLTFEMVGPGQGYNDVLFTRDAGHVRHADQLHAAAGPPPV